MKFTNPLPTNLAPARTICGPLNVFSLTAVSMIWGHMLGILNIWFLPITVTAFCIGYGSEIRKPLPTKVS